MKRVILRSPFLLLSCFYSFISGSTFWGFLLASLEIPHLIPQTTRMNGSATGIMTTSSQINMVPRPRYAEPSELPASLKVVPGFHGVGVSVGVGV